jgi:hypothetical protein
VHRTTSISPFSTRPMPGGQLLFEFVESPTLPHSAEDGLLKAPTPPRHCPRPEVP